MVTLVLVFTTNVTILEKLHVFLVIVVAILFARCHYLVYLFNPLRPHDASKHHFTSLKTDLIFPQPRVLE